MPGPVQVTEVVDIDKDYPQENKQSSLFTGCYSKDSATIFVLWQTQRLTEGWENFIVEKRKAPCAPRLKAVGMGKLETPS